MVRANPFSSAFGRMGPCGMAIELSVRLLAALMLFAATVGAVWADAPGRVARLSDYANEVQLANEHEDWHPIARNYVVAAGDNLWVVDGGRAELDVGGMQIWLAGGSNVYFEQFDDVSLVARLAQGAMIVRVRRMDAGDLVRVLLPQGDVSLLAPGLYVFAADAGGSATLAVRSGRAEALAAGGGRRVERGASVVLDGYGVRLDGYAPPLPPGFDAWASARDRRIAQWDAGFDQRYGGDISPLMIGLRDLDSYGSWSVSSDYGRVWFPSAVAVDWAPYRFGRWAWVQPWGWTWVDDAPWGFAPFHYGRWVRFGGRWGWCPGEYVQRPIYAPALVAFFGGNGWSVTVGGAPTFSWVPLGWNEPYVPWYTYSPSYWHRVNRPYVRNIAEDPWRPAAYVNAAVVGAVTAVPSAAFVSGRPVAQAYVRNVAEAVVRNAPVARIGEVVPRFAPSRGMAPGVVRPQPTAPTPPTYNGRPDVNRFPASGGVRERIPYQPNVNVLQPQVRHDPNPVVGRPGAPLAPMPSTPGRPFVQPPMTSPNPGLREPAIPMPKEHTERGLAPRAPAVPPPPTRIEPPPPQPMTTMPTAPVVPPRVSEPRPQPPTPRPPVMERAPEIRAQPAPRPEVRVEPQRPTAAPRPPEVKAPPPPRVEAPRPELRPQPPVERKPEPHPAEPRREMKPEPVEPPRNPPNGSLR